MAVGLELLRKSLVDPSVCLRVRWFSGVGKTIQELGRCNRPPMPEKPILSQVGPSVAWSTWRARRVVVDLEDYNARDG